MPQVIWAEAALRDLRSIDSFLSAANPDAALRVLKSIRTKADRLRSYPKSAPQLEGDLRYLSIQGTPYVIVYRLAEGRVEVLRVRHAREDWRPS